MSERADAPTVGWIGAGRMGAAMIRRLLLGGQSVEVWNRTAARGAALADEGASVVTNLHDAAAHTVLFTSLAASADLQEVTDSILDAPVKPEVLVDTSTVSVAASAYARQRCTAQGIAFLSAPVSGNPAALEAGTASFVCSGDQHAFQRVEPLLRTIGQHASYLGSGDEARIAKISHNVLLAIITQGLAEVLVLCEKQGISAQIALDFLNGSVLGSTFTRYKTPAIIAGDLTPTFTSRLLLKDLDLGLAEGTLTGTPLPVSGLVRAEVLSAIAQGHGDDDFLSLLAVQARASGIEFPFVKEN
jgi:3-hydroxyisobutyrate dehydrogenase-like beta-hydroxyacid dehydrogenase